MNQHTILKMIRKLLMVAPILFSCQSNEQLQFNELQYSVHSIRIYDVSNTQTAQDIIINASVRPHAAMTELRFYFADIKRIENVADINIGALHQTPHVPISIGSEDGQLPAFEYLDWDIEVQFPFYAVDIHGQPIRPNTEYIIFIEVVANDFSILSNDNARFSLSDSHPFAGHYISSDGQMSMELIYNPPLMEGLIYYTSRWRPCCGGNDDGNIEMLINPDGTITDINVNVHLDNYLEEETYENFHYGSGNIDSYKQISIIAGGLGDLDFIKQ